MIINKLKNAYGIKELHFETGNNELRNVIVYSSNGTFKSSFSNCLENMSNGLGAEVKDRLSITGDDFLDCEIIIGDDKYDQSKKLENVLVYSRELFDDNKINWTKDKGVSKLIVSKDYQKQIFNIKEKVNNIKQYYNNIIDNAKLNKVIGSIDGTVTFDEYISLEKLRENLELLRDIEVIENAPKDFDINKIIQKVYVAIDDKDFVECANAIVEIVNKELKSNFFDETFSIDNINAVVESLEKNNFLNSKRRICIKYNDEEHSFDDVKMFKNFIHEQITSILEKKPESLELKKKLENSLGPSKTAIKLKKQLEDISWLNFYSNGRVKIVNSYIASKIDRVINERYIKEIELLENEVKQLKFEISNQKVLFEKALEIHKERFNPPFKIIIENKSDSIINAKVPQFKFYPNLKIEVEKNFETTREILSSGEKNAFDIINLIVKYEAHENKGELTIVLDDLVETFDYSNRIAFIEYIQDMKKNNSNIIILTHNFEFFRTLSQRLDNSFKKYSAYNNDGIVKICKNDCFHFEIKKMMQIKDLSNLGTQKDLNEKEYFLASLPFAREILGFVGESNDLVYLFHYKKEKINVSVKDVVSDISNKINNYKIADSAKKLEECETNYYDFVLDVCNFVVLKDILHYDLFRKIILSMGCRIKVEQLMINSEFNKINGITRNQTQNLFEKEKDNISEKGQSLVRRVLLSTGEYIHLNAFMYEPLIDVDPKDLIILFKDLMSVGDSFYI